MTQQMNKKVEVNENSVLVPLTALVSNTCQTRGMGALPTLQGMGYGIFEKLPEHDDKEPIWKMLLSPQAETRKAAVALIQEYEGHIVDKAESLEASGQIQNIVVVEVKGHPGKYDIVAGMLRALSVAYNRAISVKSTDTVEAKVIPAQKTLDLLFLALDENENRREESAIDKAMTYKKLRDEHQVKPDEIGKRQGRSGQSVRDYIRLLDPLLEDKRLAIHNGTITIEKALKILKKRKDGASGEDDSTKAPNKRARMHSVKKLTIAYAAKKKPEWMEQKEWEMLAKEDVRRWLAYALKLKFKDFSGELVTEEPEEAAPAAKPFALIIPRSLADKLLVALGKESAPDWSDDVVKEKLEGIVNLVEDGQTLEDAKLQGILDKLVKNYARGLNLTIKNKAKTAAAA